MAKLSVAFNRTLDAPALKVYWDRLKGHSDIIFRAAVEHLVDTTDHFPNIAAIHRAYYDERDRIDDERMSRPVEKEQAMLDAHANARRLAVEGLPSDVMFRKGRKVIHSPGSPSYEAWLRISQQLIDSLTIRVEDRATEIDARPDDHDLVRRFGLLTATLAEAERRHEHFRQTGEILPPENMQPSNLPIVHPGTLFLCPTCKSTDQSVGGFVRIDNMPGDKHFGGSGAGANHTPIPCPHCNADAYARYTAKYGVPPGMPNF